MTLFNHREGERFTEVGTTGRIGCRYKILQLAAALTSHTSNLTISSSDLRVFVVKNPIARL